MCLGEGLAVQLHGCLDTSVETAGKSARATVRRQEERRENVETPGPKAKFC